MCVIFHRWENECPPESAMLLSSFCFWSEQSVECSSPPGWDAVQDGEVCLMNVSFQDVFRCVISMCMTSCCAHRSVSKSMFKCVPISMMQTIEPVLFFVRNSLPIKNVCLPIHVFIRETFASCANGLGPLPGWESCWEAVAVTWKFSLTCGGFALNSDSYERFWDFDT